MIKVVRTGVMGHDMEAVQHSINWSEEIITGTAVANRPIAQAFAAGTVPYGGLIINRQIFRERLPDDNWIAYAAGWADPGDATGMQIDIVYQQDSSATVGLAGGSVALMGVGVQKWSMGPAFVYPPQGPITPKETIACLRLQVTKLVGGVCMIHPPWQIWVRCIPPIH